MLTLRKVTEKNVWALLKLSVDETQKNYVATNTESIVEAYTTITSGGVALPFGIYRDDTPVGFVMIGYDTSVGEFGKPMYSVWRLMIDKKEQHKGYGRAALQLALDYIRTFPCGKADACYLSYEPENTVAKALYASFGFVENGEFDEGEAIAVLPL